MVFNNFQMDAFLGGRRRRFLARLALIHESQMNRLFHDGLNGLG